MSEKVIRVEFIDFAKFIWMSNHPNLIFNFGDDNNGRTIELMAHADGSMNKKLFIKQVENKLKEVMDTPLHMIMHQDIKRSKELIEKVGNHPIFEPYHVSIIAFTLDEGIPTTLEFETFKGCENLPEFFTIGESLLEE